LSLLEHRLAEPVQRRISPSRRLAGGNQGAIAELGAEVPRARVDGNLGRVVTREGVLPEQRIETELLGTRHFNRAIQRRAHGDPADRPGDVISRHGLKECRWQPNRRAASGFIGDALMKQAGRTSGLFSVPPVRVMLVAPGCPPPSWQVR
jgi:hypothetical protein